MKEFIITFRESLESVLIIGILFTFFVKMDNKKAIKWLWYGVLASIAGSIVFAYILLGIQNQLKSSVYEKLFESLLMYLAAGFIFYMVLWMKRNIGIKNKLEEQANLSLTSTSYKAVFFLAFFAVLREGFETVLMLIGSDSSDSFSYLGFLGGIALAILIGFGLFIQGKKINLKSFFNATSLLLILFAAGMIAYGTHEMEEFLVKSNYIEKENISKVWDILKPSSDSPVNETYYTFNESKGKFFHILHDKGSVGVFLKGFFGYNSDPNYVEFFLWIFSLTAGLFIWKKKN